MSERSDALRFKILRVAWLSGVKNRITEGSFGIESYHESTLNVS